MNILTRMIIAIDGPSASGKGTVAKRLAEHFSLPYLDTGLLYRAVTFVLLQRGFSPENEKAASTIAKSFKDGVPDGLMYDAGLRSEIVSRAASFVAAMPEVRRHLLDFQKSFAYQPNGAVLDGRDIGTVIAPDTPLKLYITANPSVRAERRMKELHLRGQKVTYEAVLEDMQARDARDETRDTAPAKVAPGAAVLDTSGLNADEAFAAALQIVKEKMASLKT
jgi:cytidylate kinase